MSSTWLTSVANLLVFFRWTTVWLNAVMLGLSLIPFTILYICIFGVTGVAFIYNISVCIVQHKEKKRSANGLFPVPSLAVIMFDYLFALLYLTGWILATFIFGMSNYGNLNWRNTYYYGSFIFVNYTSIGCLVACHYHLFYAAVNTHIRRKQAQGAKFYMGGVHAGAVLKTFEVENAAESDNVVDYEQVVRYVNDPRIEKPAKL